MILDKCSYISAIEEVLNDNSKFSKGSRQGILYKLGIIHKETCNGIPRFCPILSAIDTPTYELAKFLLRFLTLSTANEFTVIDSFHFAE